jgi:3-mercaptopyruvate sulfurtransferase SseA
MNKGYRKIRPLEGGLDAWIDAGGEVNIYSNE